MTKSIAERSRDMSNTGELASPCGLFCGICPVYRAKEDRALAEKLAPKLGLPVEKVPCRGCRAQQGKVLGHSTCPTYQCVTGRGYEFCYQCADFPCLKLAPAAHRADDLPHNQKIYNLLLIQKAGLENWAQEAQNIQRRYFRGKKNFGGDELKLEDKVER